MSAPNTPPTIRCSPGLIEVIDARAFGLNGSGKLQQVKATMQSVPLVQSVAIDARRGCATIRFPASCRLPDVLRGVANALRQRPAEAASPAKPALFKQLPKSLVVTFRRTVYLTLAGVSFGMSIVGVILPGIPTVPFLLLTSYFLVRSSPSLNERLLNSRTFGPLIRDWQQYRGMRMKAKLWIIAFVLVTVGLTLLFSEPPVWLLVVMFGMGSLSICYIWSLPTVPEHQPDAGNLAFNS